MHAETGFFRVFGEKGKIFKIYSNFKQFFIIFFQILRKIGEIFIWIFNNYNKYLNEILWKIRKIR